MDKYFTTRRLTPVFLILLLGLTACNDSDTNTETLSAATVTSVSPTEARVGDTITVSGESFGVAQGSSTLSISGVVATSIISWNNNEIMATVPTGAGTGDVTVALEGVDGTPGTLIVPWVVENPDNVPISVENSYQQGPVSVSDGRGGAIIVWGDRRNGTDLDLYAQRVNSAGVVQWAANGVPIVIASSTQTNPKLVSDGNGGAIIAWGDARGANYDIYAQRINSAGVVQWATNGVVICNAANAQNSVTMLADGSGGAFIGWNDNRVDFGDTYIQRINSAGVAQWTNNGVAIAALGDTQGSPLMVPDGSGGAILVWNDSRGSAATDHGLYAQRVNSAGVPQWVAHGVPVVRGYGGYDSHKVISDGSGGAFIVWRAYLGADYDIYAQRINGSGVVQWAGDDGVAISVITGYQDFPSIVSDGSGGAIIAWQDSRSGAQYVDEDIYAQRINSAGVVQWAANGIPIITATGVQNSPMMVSDDNGGAIMVWGDWRNGTNYDLYAQRINSAGASQWTADGEAIRTATNHTYTYNLISDGYGGAIIAFQDRRNEAAEGDIYAQGITGSGLQ